MWRMQMNICSIWTIINSYLSPQFKNMIIHIFICILHILRVYCELTKWPVPSGLIAQSVEHCTGIAEVMGSNPVQAWIYLSCVCNCDDQSQIHLIDWLIDWLVDWLTGWLVDWLTDWLTDWLSDWLTDWLTDWLIDWLSNVIVYPFIYAFMHSFTSRLNQ